MTAQEFRKGLTGFEANMLREIDLRIRRIGLELLKKLIDKTPVDTGHLRHNWQVTINTQTDTELPGEDAGGIATFNREKVKLTNLGLGPLVVFQNPAPYAEIIEMGRTEKSGSTQAPQGMVRVSLQEVANTYNLQVIG